MVTTASAYSIELPGPGNNRIHVVRDPVTTEYTEIWLSCELGSWIIFKIDKLNLALAEAGLELVEI